jgi:GTP-binding protein
MAFTDETTIHVRAGKGGDGVATFRKQPYEPKGPPEGGDGGHGGSVVLEVSRSVGDLSHLADHPHQRAADGASGGRSRRHGARGADRVVPVPDGTVVHDERGFVADLVGEGARVVVARGGRGGRGNASLAGPNDRMPRTAERGEEGEERTVQLELRTVADVGLVGLPNAGKSTLLSKLSAARPKVASYPFTTLTPNLGVAGTDDPAGERFVVADVPGLVEGAAEGRGLGHRFLRHVTRCRALALVVDLSAEDPAADLATVRAELAAYDPALAVRPAVIAATKVDLLDEAERARRAGALDATGEVIEVSGETGEGVERLSSRLGELAQAAAAAEPERVPYVVLRPGREAFTVEREGDGFRVRGRSVERWVAEADLDDPASVTRLQRRLKKAGVERNLEAAGAVRGDEVTIGQMAFEYIPDQNLDAEPRGEEEEA